MSATMQRNRLRRFPGVTAVLAISASLAAAPLGSQERSCEALGAPNLKVSFSETLAFRLPSSSDLNVSSACRAQVDDAIARWKDQDAQSFEEQANRVCSYQLGWMERNPGTCRAGGPPPICKVDHWIKTDPRLAFNQYRDRQLEVKELRAKQLVRAACHCRRAELEASDPDSPRQSVAKEPTVSNNVYNMNSVPCVNGSCGIPGMSCSAGFCRAPTQNEHYAKEALDKLVDQGKDQLKEHALKALSASVSALSKSFGGSILTRLFQARTLSTNQSLYENQIREVSASVNELNRLNDELAAYHASRPARAPQYIQEEIAKQKAELTNHVQMLNLAYQGMVIERELRDEQCPEVVEFQQQRVNQIYANLMATN